jgi:hypothetical protein
VTPVNLLKLDIAPEFIVFGLFRPKKVCDSECFTRGKPEVANLLSFVPAGKTMWIFQKVYMCYLAVLKKAEHRSPNNINLNLEHFISKNLR